MLWLDHLIFGNGRGMKSPFFDDQLYWLVDTKDERKAGRGALYSYSGGFGAQLTSRQWFHPQPGERRRLIGRDFRPFNSRRRWLRVEVSWVTPLPARIDDANSALRRLRTDLNSGTMEPTNG